MKRLTPTEMRAIAVTIANTVAKKRNEVTREKFEKNFTKELATKETLQKKKKSIEKEIEAAEEEIRVKAKKFGIPMERWGTGPVYFAEFSTPTSPEANHFFQKLVVRNIDPKTLDVQKLIDELVGEALSGK